MAEYHITNLTLQSYQQTAVEWSRNRETPVVCLPTGSGKTLVGCQWACSQLNETDSGRILTIEPSRYLVKQTVEYFHQETNIEIKKLYGTTPSGERQHQWDSGSVVVTTPQTAYNDIEWLDFDAAVIRNADTIATTLEEKQQLTGEAK